MAVFSTSAIQMPDLNEYGQTILKTAAAQREKQEKLLKEQKDARERKTSALGAEKLYSSSAYKLESAAKEAAQLVYDKFKDSAINYEMTGSESDKSKMEDYFNQLNQVIGVGIGVASAVDQEYELARTKPSSFTPESIKDIEGRYNSRRATSFNVQADAQGNITAEYNGQRVPISSHPYFNASSTPGVNNLGLVPVDPSAKYLDTNKLAAEYVNNFANSEGVRIDTGSGLKYDKGKLIEKSRASFDNKIAADPDFLNAVIMSHKFKGRDISAEEKANAMNEYASDGELMKAAIDEYWGMKVKPEIERLTPAEAVGAATGGGGGGGRMTQREEDDNNAINDLISSSIELGTGGARGIGFRIYDDPIEIKENGVFGGNTTGYVTSFRITPNGDFLIGKVDGSGGNAKVVSILPKKSGETDAQYKERTEGYNDALVALNKRFPRQILPRLQRYVKEQAVAEEQAANAKGKSVPTF
jgi:hypothetical protein